MSTLINPGLSFGNAVAGVGGTKYTRLQNEMESPHRNYPMDDNSITIDGTQQQHLILDTQDNSMDRLRQSMGALRTVGHAMNHEVEEQAV